MNVYVPVLTTGERIRKDRRDHANRTGQRVSQERFATLIGASKAQVELWERDESSPDLRSLFAICDVTGVALGWLLSEFMGGGRRMPRGSFEDQKEMNRRLDAEENTLGLGDGRAPGTVASR